MNFDELYSIVLGIFPNASIGEDNDGQLVIYTDMMLGKNDEVIPFENEDLENLREF